MKIPRLAMLWGAALALALAATAAFAQAAPAQSQAPKMAPRYFEKLSYPKLHEIKAPDIVQETLPNGLRLLLVEDHDLPEIHFHAVVKGGRLAEPKHKAGLTELFGEVQRTGGTQSMSGDAADEYLERIGASIETDVDESYSTASGKCLTETLDKVLPLYAEFLMAPGLTQDKIDLAKTHMKGMIARRNDDAFGLTYREFVKLIYGKDSPYARQFEYDDVDGLTRDDLVAYHALCYHPDQTILAVWGDFKVPEMRTKLAKAFGDWKKGEKPLTLEEPFVFPPAPSLNYVEKKDVEQAFILMGHLSLKMDDPDYPAVLVMSEILGGGMSSRLFVEVREKRGLAYSASGAVAPAYDHQGAFYVFASTKPSTMSQTLALIIEEIKRIQKEPVTDEEMRLAKEGYLNRYAFQFDSTAKVVERMQTYLFYGYPLDFNQTLRDKVEKVTKEDVLRVAKKTLMPDALAILAVGKQSDWDKPLSTFGTVNTIDITIPEPKAKETVPEATPETLAKGKEILMAAAKAAGEKALRELKDLTTESAVTVTTPGGPMELKAHTVFVLPDRICTTVATPMGEMVQVLDAGKAWMSMGGRVRDLPGTMVDEMKRAVWSGDGALMTLRGALEDKVKAQYIGKAKFQDKEVQDVYVTLPTGTMHLYIAPDTKEVAGLKRRGLGESGPTDVVEVFSKYQAFSGLKVPMETREDENGETAESAKLSDAKVNAGFSEDIFKKPEAKPEDKK